MKVGSNLKEYHQGNDPIALACFSMHTWPERLDPCTQLGVHIKKKPAINAIIYPYSSPAHRLFCFLCSIILREMSNEVFIH